MFLNHSCFDLFFSFAQAAAAAQAGASVIQIFVGRIRVIFYQYCLLTLLIKPLVWSLLKCIHCT